MSPPLVRSSITSTGLRVIGKSTDCGYRRLRTHRSWAIFPLVDWGIGLTFHYVCDDHREDVLRPQQVVADRVADRQAGHRRSRARPGRSVPNIVLGFAILVGLGVAAAGWGLLARRPKSSPQVA